MAAKQLEAWARGAVGSPEPVSQASAPDSSLMEVILSEKSFNKLIDS